MHDLFEGICRYELALILFFLIFNEKHFTYTQFKERMQKYDSHSKSKKNMTPLIKLEHLKNKKIVVSASEMIYLLNNLSFLVGDLVPTNSKTWKLYLSLRELVSLIMSPSFSDETIDRLERQIKTHHTSYKKLSEESLKPKHHHLLHYVRILKILGPLRLFSCMRFEGFHRDLKKIASSVTSRVNISLTIAKRCQLKLNYRFLTSQGFGERFETGKGIMHNVTLLPEFKNFKNVLTENIINNYTPLSWVSFCGVIYTSNFIVTRKIEKTMLFAEILYVLFCESSKDVIFLCKSLQTIVHSMHFSAYQVEYSDEWLLISFKDLINEHFSYNFKKLPNSKMYVSCNI